MALAIALTTGWGGYADTNAAISCAKLGAKYGHEAIPHYYIENLYNRLGYQQTIEKIHK